MPRGHVGVLDTRLLGGLIIMALVAALLGQAYKMGFNTLESIGFVVIISMGIFAFCALFVAVGNLVVFVGDVRKMVVEWREERDSDE